MPHIVFDKKIDLLDFVKKFEPVFHKNESLIKITTIFVDKDNLTALLPTIAISDINQQYLIEISTRQSKTTIRLYPGTDPEKTDSVKLSLVILAKQIATTYSEFNVTKTNLSDYFKIVDL